jgi:hypothetical protein
MNASSLSHHALTRMDQRAIRQGDVDLIRLIGTEVPDGFIVLDRDRQEAERTLQLLLDRVRRLAGTRMVVAGERVVTVYRADKQKERRLVRRAEQRQLAR